MVRTAKLIEGKTQSPLKSSEDNQALGFDSCDYMGKVGFVTFI